MKIARIDVDKLEQGDWVSDIPEAGELRIKTRGAQNKDWRKLAVKLTSAVPRSRRGADGSLAPEDNDKILAVLLRDTAILDWEGLEDEDGKPLPYSKEQANEYLTNPETRDFFDAALFAANNVARQRKQAVEADAKN